nr:hypothetical protein [Candidatus Saccharibacteria bacterium]
TVTLNGNTISGPQCSGSSGGGTSGGTSGGTTPGLPNTGISSQNHLGIPLWSLPFVAIVATPAIYLIRKKRKIADFDSEQA